MRNHFISPTSTQTDHFHTGSDDILDVVDITAEAAELDAFDDHTVVFRGTSQSSGLDALIALYDTTLGPALGGCRIWKYAQQEDALQDVLRLSKGMSYKAAMAGLPLGGGKAVINCDSHTGKTEDMLRSFAALVDLFEGTYVTAEDVGTTVADMDVISGVTPHVLGRVEDPSPVTALGVMIGMQAALLHRFGVSSLSGVTIAVLGLGKVGMSLCEQTHKAGAKLIVADLEPDLVKQAVDLYGAQAVSCEAIVKAQADIFAPCAMGGVMNEKTIPMMRAAIIAGSANNQLMVNVDGQRLHDMEILYAPDYVINSGGLISAYLQMPSASDTPLLSQRLEGIGETLNDIFEISKQENHPTNVIADRLAKEKIDTARRNLHPFGVKP